MDFDFLFFVCPWWAIKVKKWQLQPTLHHICKPHKPTLNPKAFKSVDAPRFDIGI
jgi:hypothetical protein